MQPEPRAAQRICRRRPSAGRGVPGGCLRGTGSWLPRGVETAGLSLHCGGGRGDEPRGLDECSEPRGFRLVRRYGASRVHALGHGPERTSCPRVQLLRDHRDSPARSRETGFEGLSNRVGRPMRSEPKHDPHSQTLSLVCPTCLSLCC